MEIKFNVVYFYGPVFHNVKQKLSKLTKYLIMSHLKP